MLRLSLTSRRRGFVGYRCRFGQPPAALRYLLERIDAGFIAYGDLVMAKTDEASGSVYSPAPALQQIRRSSLVSRILTCSRIFGDAEYHRSADTCRWQESEEAEREGAA